jgi:uncharacterized membrane protein
MGISTGFSIALLAFYVFLIIGSITAMLFMVIAIWKAMRAHESIAGSMKAIAETLLTQARAADKKEEF